MRKVIFFVILNFFFLQLYAKNYIYIGCYDDLEYSDIPKHEIRSWKSNFSFFDGSYEQAYVSYKDGIGGYLYQGGNTLRYFVEDAAGYNHYYADYEAAIRAL